MKSNMDPRNDAHPDPLARADVTTTASHSTCSRSNHPFFPTTALWSHDGQWVYVCCTCGAQRRLRPREYHSGQRAPHDEAHVAWGRMAL